MTSITAKNNTILQTNSPELSTQKRAGSKITAALFNLSNIALIGSIALAIITACNPTSLIALALTGAIRFAMRQKIDQNGYELTCMSRFSFIVWVSLAAPQQSTNAPLVVVSHDSRPVFIPQPGEIPPSRPAEERVRRPSPPVPLEVLPLQNEAILIVAPGAASSSSSIVVPATPPRRRTYSDPSLTPNRTVQATNLAASSLDDSHSSRSAVKNKGTPRPALKRSGSGNLFNFFGGNAPNFFSMFTPKSRKAKTPKESPSPSAQDI